MPAVQRETLQEDAIERPEHEDECLQSKGDTLPEKAIERPQREDECLQTQGTPSQRRPLKDRSARMNAYRPKGNPPRGGQ